MGEEGVNRTNITYDGKVRIDGAISTDLLGPGHPNWLGPGPKVRAHE